MEEYEYDFAFECRRLVEAMAPRSARSFRQEFNMQDLATTEHTFTTHYTSEKYIRTSHSTELDGHAPIKSMTNGKLSSPNYATKTIIGDDERPDVRNLKRVHKMYEGPNIIESRGIVHPETREILTVGQAISMRILDVRTGRLLSSANTRQTISIEQAAKEGLIDPKLAARLTGPCGMTEDGNEVTLLEAIQRELYDAEQGLTDPAEKRIKVTVEGEKPNQGMSISDALNRGQVDLQRGLYRLPNGSYISIAEAYQRGYLIYNEIIKIKSSALSLSDAISQELVDNSGWILDRNSGDRFQLDIAIKNELINPNVREVVDPKNDTKITLAEAIEKNIINTKLSKYVHNLTKEKMTFKEAASKRFICKPMTLKDICDNNLMTNDGKILSPTNRTPLNILEAISAGVLDSDSIKCVTDTTTGQLLTLSEALGARIILHDNKFRDNLTGEICTIPEAVDRGLITSVSQRSIFDIDGFKDPKTGEFISFNSALSKGILKYVNGETFLKSESGDFVFLEDCPKVSIVRPEVLEMFNRKIGVFDSSKELSVLDAVFKNVLDPRTGYLLDSATKKPIPFNKAVEINMITPEGAALLNSLLNITLTLQTVTKTVKRYVTITNTSQRSETIITFAEAVRRGLIDEATQTFTDPTTGTVFPIQQALDEGLLGVDQNDPRVARISDRVTKKELIPGQVVELKITKKSFIKDPPLSPESKLHQDNRPETVKSPDYIIRESVQPREEITREIKTMTSKSVVSDPSVTSLTIKKNTIELPRGGWTLQEAIQQNLFNPETGMFVIPGTDRVLDLKEAISLNIINPESAVVVDPKLKKEIAIDKALEFNVIDSTGHYKHGNKLITMKQAIEQEIIIFVSLTKTTSTQKVITITSIAGMPDKMEISEVQRTTTAADLDEQSILEPVQVASGIIYDPATALVISTTSGVSENIIDAVDRGIVPLNVVHVTDPETGTQISLKQAIERGIIDKNAGEYKNGSGRSISLANATKVGLIAVIGAPLVAASKVIQLVRSTMVVDPNTGEELPMEVAYERGLVDPDTYKNYEESITRKTPEIDVAKAIEKDFKSDPNLFSISKVIKTTIVDPRTGEKMTIEEANTRGLVDPETYKKYKESQNIASESVQHEILINEPSSSKTSFSQITNKPISVGAAVSDGFITVESIQSSLSADNRKFIDKSTKPKPAYDTDVIQLNKNQITNEPKYTIEVDDSKMSTSIDIKPVVLQKLRRRVVMPTEAIEMGLIDKETANVLEIVKTYKDEMGKQATLEQAIEFGLIDENKGKILDPVRGDYVTIKEAIRRGILDPEGQNEILIPLARSLTIPEVLKQGLLHPVTGKIIHPETGSHLSLREAIICDIVDPLSPVTIAPGHNVSLQEAIAKNIVDSEKNTIKTSNGALDLVSGVNAEIFPNIKPNAVNQIPPAGMTLSVAVKQNIVNPNTGRITHPLTGQNIDLNDAIENGFIMDIPYPQTSSTVSIEEALKDGIINLKDGVIVDQKTNEILTLDKALEKGLVAVKLNKDITETGGIVTTITETFTSQHTVTTRMVELLVDYVLISSNEVQNTKTGEIISIEEARKKGIIKDEQTNKEQFITSDTNISFDDALNLGYINLEQGTFTHPQTGEILSITEAVNSGLLNTETTKDVTPDVKQNMEMLDLHEAFELLFDEKTQKFRDPTTPNKVMTFTEALEKQIINPESVVFNIEKGKATTLQEAMKAGLIDKDTGKIREPETGKAIDIKKAAKMGLIAVVAAPVLAGMAVVQGAKIVSSKLTKSKPDESYVSVTKSPNKKESLVTQETYSKEENIIQSGTKSLQSDEFPSKTKTKPANITSPLSVVEHTKKDDKNQLNKIESSESPFKSSEETNTNLSKQQTIILDQPSQKNEYQKVDHEKPPRQTQELKEID